MREGRYELRARGRDRERGASLVEFAFVVPLLTLFLFGIVQFGIAYDMKQSVNSASREGARIGALDDSTLVDITTRAREAFAATASAGAMPTVIVEDENGGVHGSRSSDGSYVVPAGESSTAPGSMPCGGDPQDLRVVVIVSKPYDITIPFWGVQPVTLTSKAEFRCE